MGQKAPALGRPRTVPRVSTQDIAEEILDCAARLFAIQGYEGTSTRQIADAAGLKQGSLFHHFARKSDMMAALLGRTLRPAMVLVDWAKANALEADVGFYMLVRADVVNICSGRFNLASLIHAPVLKEPEFDWFWEKRAVLVGAYAEMIRKGVTAGLFACTDVKLATAQVFGMIEAVVFWFDRNDWDSDVVADEVAASALRILGIGSAALEAVRQRAGVAEDAPPTFNPYRQKAPENE